MATEIPRGASLGAGESGHAHPGDAAELLAVAEQRLAAGDPRSAEQCILPLLNESSRLAPQTHARALILAAAVKRLLGRDHERHPILEESRRVLDEHRILQLEADWRLEAMLWSLRRGELADAEQHGYAALAMARWSRERRGLMEARATANLARISMARGEWRPAVRHLQTAAAYFRDCEDRERLAQFNKDMARCLYHLGRWDEATDALRRALAWFAESGSAVKEAHCWTALAMVAVAAGDARAAAEHVKRAGDLAGSNAPPRTLALIEEVQGDRAAMEGQLHLAVQRYNRGLELVGRAALDRDVSTELLHRRASVLLRLGKPEQARADAEQAVAVAREASERVEEAAALRVRGLALAALGMVSEARGDIEASLRIAVECDERLEEARACEALAELRTRTQEGCARSDEGMPLLFRARNLFASLGCVKDATRLDKKLAARPVRAPRRLGRSGGPPGRASQEETEFLTEDPRILADLDRLRRARDRILILGETGTGKELIAKILHRESDRGDGPFVVVDCAAMAQGLIESELFGFRKGTFTGAARDRKGLIESAHGGTLFLDEIAELPLDMQSRLLRAVQERQARRLGETTYQDVDFRLIAATNRDLGRMVEEGRFRSDLYFRLRGAMLIIPPLRQRPGDVLLIAEHLFELNGGRSGRPLVVSPEVYEALLRYGWPGNVRELISEIENLVLQAPGNGVIRPEMLSDALRARCATPEGAAAVRATSLLARLDTLKEEEVLSALRRCAGNRTRAAQELGLTLRGLSKILARLRAKGRLSS